MSSFMLSHLAGIVANGSRTSFGFKKVHFNQYQKINWLRNLSAFGFDEEKFIITLDLEHYNDHIKDHKNDAEFLNKPLEHFVEMVTIFGNSMAIDKYLKTAWPQYLETAWPQHGDTQCKFVLPQLIRRTLLQRQQCGNLGLLTPC
ncbi:hypothetical protein BAE44_0011340 [Dichanthelium oligosanthes]|uniref:Uncharacterized protein n=1 Tax=Dichanthelium oligosanthes TaxID=888268 RepID=A0A1E5VRA1_9POAL|nr:hypothetical protein BAE44_0011340 [Dichanthelium oligosanthes]